MGPAKRWRDLVVLCALAPESLRTIRAIVRPSRDTNLAEARFTLAVVVGSEIGSGVAWFLPFVVDHLERTREDVRLSSFACGCLLGMEWPEGEALPILVRLSRKARFPAGRTAAIHGLEHLAEDGSPRVRSAASRALRTMKRPASR